MARVKREYSYTPWIIGFCSVIVICFLFVLGRFLLVTVQESSFSPGSIFVIGQQTDSGQAQYIVCDPSQNTLQVITLAHQTAPLPTDLALVRSVSLSSPLNPLAMSMAIHKASGGKFTALDTALFALFLFHQPKVETLSADDWSDFSVSNSPLLDQSVIAENRTVQIVNASDQTGAASQLSQELTLFGYNVISVQTGVDPVMHTNIATDALSSYSVKQLSRRLHIGANALSGSSVADIVVTLGEDWKQ